MFGKDIRTLLAICCQKIFFEEGHSYYHYGPIEREGYYNRNEMDLQVSSSNSEVPPYVSSEKRGNRHNVIVTDRVFEYTYLKSILAGMFARREGIRLKSDNVVLNLSLLSLQLDFGEFASWLSVYDLTVNECFALMDSSF